MNEIVKQLGERIRHLRKQQDISQEILGERSGIHSNYIGQVERGEKNITLESLSKLATGLGISMEELFRSIDPVQEEDHLGKINKLLSSRSHEDQMMVLNIVQRIFEWEEAKN